MNKYISFDVESGGITTNESLLEVTLTTLDEKLNPTDSLTLKLKPENGNYIVNAGALKVNQINLVEHDKTALTYSQGRELLVSFLKKNKGTNKLIPLGQAVGFDVAFVQTYLLGIQDWQEYVSYRLLDTASVAQFLIDTGHIPESTGASLSALEKFFGTQNTTDIAHTSSGDVNRTVAVYKKMLIALD